MNDTIIFGNWQGFKDKGLAPRELEATVLAAGDLTIKQIAKHMGVSPWTAKDRIDDAKHKLCLLYTSPSPRDRQKSRMPSSA